MRLTSEQAEKRLNSEDNLARFAVPEKEVKEIVIHNAGNTHKPKLPPAIRTEIAVRSRMGESQKSLAREFGVSQPAISAIERGRTNSDEDKVDETLNKVRDIALNKLMSSLGLISDEKLAQCSPTQLAGIANQISNVVERSLPKSAAGRGDVNLIIYTPEIRDEHKYKVVEI